MKRSATGSVLLEALIAVVVMAVGLTALMQALMNSSRVISEVQDYGRAWILINEKFQEKYIFDKTNVSYEHHQAVAPLERFEDTVHFTALTQEPWSGLTQMDITVTWHNGNNNRSIGLRTLLSNDNTNQTTKSIFYN